MKTRTTFLQRIALWLLVIPAATGAFAQTDDWYYIDWADEFDGDTLNTDIWTVQVRDNGFSSQWSASFVDSEEVLFLRDGNLVIKAVESERGCPFISGSIWTGDKKTVKYGKVEVRFKLPKGRGTAPSVWMMPQDLAYGGWPNSGEIDVMEHVGARPDRIYGMVHRSAGAGDNADENYILFDGETDGYHIAHIEWEPDSIQWYLDDQLYHTYYNEKTGPDQWPFDQAFHLIIRFAVGGDWGAVPGVDKAIFPQEFLIDYVRVYQQAPTAVAAIDTPSVRVAVSDARLTVSGAGTDPQLTLYALSGAVLRNVPAASAMDLSALPAGSYLVAVQPQGGSKSVHKIIIR
ncbi:MAG: family 16 glycosylhydrolase [Dysgonamonadaceae bacterium]|jgi:beta-glucanase (GH16 family)|nr:family 16 glycosylhydrolase [Dysgonamonadaceae bacterium]